MLVVLERERSAARWEDYQLTVHRWLMVGTVEPEYPGLRCCEGDVLVLILCQVNVDAIRCQDEVVVLGFVLCVVEMDEDCVALVHHKGAGCELVVRYTHFSVVEFCHVREDDELLGLMCWIVVDGCGGSEQERTGYRPAPEPHDERDDYCSSHDWRNSIPCGLSHAFW